MDRSAGRIRKMFDRIAPTYDLLNHLLSAGIDRRWRRIAAETAGPGDALDLCCGTADLSLALQEAGARVVGIDFAERMLRLGREKAPGLPLAAADAMRLPFPDARFDACTVAFGLRNTRSPRTVLAEMLRVLRPGGRLVILEFVRPSNPMLRFYTRTLLPLVGNAISRSRAYSYLPRSVGAWFAPGELAEEMKEAGATDVTLRPLRPAVAMLHTARRPPSPMDTEKGGP